jgi:ubiquinone/menaquinone biosynthesis C-methylase UbiE
VDSAEDFPNLPETGERLLTTDHFTYKIEHLHRYAIALALSKGRNVLDVASGEGYGSNLLATVAKSVLGVDISGQAVNHAQIKYRRPNLTFRTGAADKLPGEGGSVDLVVSFETLEHHDKHYEMMLEIKRVLRPGGLLIMSTPDRLFYTDLVTYKNPFHVKELTLEEFRSLVAGYFNNVEMFLQKFSVGSFVAPEKTAQGFYEYWGDFDGLYSSPALQKQIYLICLASDSELPVMGTSFFDGLRAFQNTFVNPLVEANSEFERTIEKLNQTIEDLSQTKQAEEIRSRKTESLPEKTTRKKKSRSKRPNSQ